MRDIKQQNRAGFYKKRSILINTKNMKKVSASDGREKRFLLGIGLKTLPFGREKEDAISICKNSKS
jgi:hypothetical protein